MNVQHITLSGIANGIGKANGTAGFDPLAAGANATQAIENIKAALKAAPNTSRRAAGATQNLAKRLDRIAHKLATKDILADGRISRREAAFLAKVHASLDKILAKAIKLDVIDIAPAVTDAAKQAPAVDGPGKSDEAKANKAEKDDKVTGQDRADQVRQNKGKGGVGYEGISKVAKARPERTVYENGAGNAIATLSGRETAASGFARKTSVENSAKEAAAAAVQVAKKAVAGLSGTKMDVILSPGQLKKAGEDAQAAREAEKAQAAEARETDKEVRTAAREARKAERTSISGEAAGGVARPSAEGAASTPAVETPENPTTQIVTIARESYRHYQQTYQTTLLLALEASFDATV